jgi:hypothetical protein
MPRLRSETIGVGDQSWLGSMHGIYNCRTGSLDIAAFTPATHYPNGHILSGQPVDCSDESAVAPWTGGVGEVLGFLYTDQQAVDPVSGVAYDQVPAPIFRHGTVDVPKLPVALTPPADAHFTFVGV